MIIRIKNLKLRTIIGINDWERRERQDVIINIEMEINGIKAVKTDNIQDTIDYKAITKKIIKEVSNSHFYLLDKLSDYILKVVMEEKQVKRAVVEVDKPHALRYADSVSVLCSAER
jgi:FolB domain-containing protein